MEKSKEQKDLLNGAFQQYIKEQVDKSMLQFDKTLSTVADKLADEGWTLPAELGIYAVNILGNTNEISDINKFLLWYFTEDDYFHAKRMLEDILSAPIDAGIKNLIDECWFSFTNKKYLICANSLVAVIEGILSTFWEDKKNIRMMQVCQAKVDKLANEAEHIIKKYIWISYNKFISKLYEKNDFSKDEPGFINRHWLLHGRSAYKIEELDCLRLFNAVSSICVIVKNDNM